MKDSTYNSVRKTATYKVAASMLSIKATEHEPRKWTIQDTFHFQEE